MNIYPSLISSDLLNLEKTITLLDAHCTGYHLDVMDGHFVPNITWGPAFINAIRSKAKFPLHVHLMVSDPLKWLSMFKLKPTDTIIVHLESFSSTNDCHQALLQINKHGYQAGISIKPSTPIASTLSLITAELATILLMSVEPGFSGQQFMPASLLRLQDLINLRAQTNTHFSIGMDGGINEQSLKLIAPYNIEYVAIASAIFSASNIVQALQNLSDITHTKDIS